MQAQQQLGFPNSGSTAPDCLACLLPCSPTLHASSSSSTAPSQTHEWDIPAAQDLCTWCTATPAGTAPSVTCPAPTPGETICRGHQVLNRGLGAWNSAQVSHQGCHSLPSPAPQHISHRRRSRCCLRSATAYETSCSPHCHAQVSPCLERMVPQVRILRGSGRPPGSAAAHASSRSPNFVSCCIPSACLRTPM